MGKKLVDKFPEDPGFKGKEDGYDDFTKNAQDLLEAWEPMYTLIGQLVEFRMEALNLLRELSKDLIKISTEVNPLAVDRYFNFMLAYAKLYLLFGACVADQGKLVVAAYGHAHRILGRGEPRGYGQITEMVAIFERPLLRLQEDVSNTGMRAPLPPAPAPAPAPAPRRATARPPCCRRTRRSGARAPLCHAASRQLAPLSSSSAAAPLTAPPALPIDRRTPRRRDRGAAAAADDADEAGRRVVPARRGRAVAGLRAQGQGGRRRRQRQAAVVARRLGAAGRRGRSAERVGKGRRLRKGRPGTQTTTAPPPHASPARGRARLASSPQGVVNVGADPRKKDESVVAAAAPMDACTRARRTLHTAIRHTKTRPTLAPSVSCALTLVAPCSRHHGNGRRSTRC